MLVYIIIVDHILSRLSLFPFPKALKRILPANWKKLSGHARPMNRGITTIREMANAKPSRMEDVMATPIISKPRKIAY